MKLKYSLYLVILTVSQGKVIHGAYNSKLLSLKQCVNPSPPRSKFDTIEGKFDTYGTDGSLINGSVIVRKNVLIFLQFKAGGENNRKLLNYQIIYQKLTCKSLLAKVILTAANVKFNEDTCEVLKGNYHFDKIDINILDHAMSIIPIREPGINNWLLGIFGNDGTYICLILRVEITLSKPKPRQS